MDELGIDVLLTGSQKALALPPGLALFSVSERALARAATVPDRGYYFDFVEFAKNQEQDMTPSTPVIPLICCGELTSTGTVSTPRGNNHGEGTGISGSLPEANPPPLTWQKRPGQPISIATGLEDFDGRNKHKAGHGRLKPHPHQLRAAKATTLSALAR